jgi:hypothetical protein
MTNIAGVVVAASLALSACADLGPRRDYVSQERNGSPLSLPGPRIDAAPPDLRGVETTNERSLALLARLGFSFVRELPAESKCVFVLHRALAHVPRNSGLDDRNFAPYPKHPVSLTC